MNKLLPVFCLLLIAVIPVSAEWSVTGSVTQKAGFTERYVAGKFNKTSSYLDIEITLSSTPHTTSSTYFDDYPRLVFASADNIGGLSFSEVAQNTLTGCSSDANNGDTDNTKAHRTVSFGSQNADGTYSITFRFYYNCLQDLNASPDGKHFDFKVRLPTEYSASGVEKEVTFDGSSTLYIDRTNPALATSGGWLDLSSPTSKSWIQPNSNNSTFYFNGNTPIDSPADDQVEIGFKPSELLGESVGNFSNIIRFSPDDGSSDSYTIDDGNFAASQQEVSTNLTLNDGATYTIEYQIFDDAGNCSCGNDNTDYDPIQSGLVYDITKPTITGISDFQIDTDGSPDWVDLVSNQRIGDGQGKKLRYTLSFSEEVNAGASTTITYNNSQTSTIDKQTVDAVTLVLGTYSIIVEYQVDGSDHAADPLEIDIISSTGTWKDLALNEMEQSNGNTEYTIEGDDNLDPIEIDVVGPQIVQITSTPIDYKYGLGDVIPLTIIFNETVELDVSHQLNVYLDAKEDIPLDAINSTHIETVSDVSQISREYTVGATETSIGRGLSSTLLEVTIVTISPDAIEKLTDAVDHWQNPATNTTLTPTNNLQAHTTIMVETTRPTISKISTTAPDGKYGEGAVIPVKVFFYNGSFAGDPEDITLTGTSNLAIGLNSNGSATINSFAANTATGTYTVDSGDDEITQVDGWLNASAITLNGVAIADDYGNSLTSTEVPDDNFSSNDIEIDITKPFLQTITATLNDKTIAAAPTVTLARKTDVIKFIFGFNEITRLSGDATITLNSGATFDLEAYDDTHSDPQNPWAEYVVQENDENIGNNPFLDIIQDGFNLNGNKLTDNPTRTWDSDYKPNQAEDFTPDTPFLSTYSIKVDGRLPKVEQVTTSVYKYTDDTEFTQENKRYGIGSKITLQITFSEPILLSTGTISLDIGLAEQGSITISTDDILAADQSIIEKEFTVTEDDNDGSARIKVNNDKLPNPTDYTLTDVAGNETTSAGRTFTTKNIDDLGSSQIFIDAEKPSTPATIAITPDGGTAENTTDYDEFFNDTNTGITVTVTLPTNDESAENGAIYLEFKKADGTFGPLEPAGFTSIKVNNVNTDVKCYRVSDDVCPNGTCEISVTEAKLVAANDGADLEDGQNIIVRAYLIDDANNKSDAALAVANPGLTVDKTIPKLMSVSYVSTTQSLVPYLQGTDIPLRLTFRSVSGNADSSKVTLSGSDDNIKITLNVGDPNTVIEFKKSASQFGLTAGAITATGDKDYTVAADETSYASVLPYGLSPLEMTAVTVNADDVLRDLAGNPITSSDLDDDFNDAGFTNLTGVYVDGIPPEAPNIITIEVNENPDPPAYTTTIASCDCADFWNQYATEAVFTYDIVAADQSMYQGKAYVLARTGDDPFTEVGTIDPVVTQDQARANASITITVESADFDAETSWWPNEQSPPEADDVEFKIRLEDWAGNTTLTEDVVMETRTIHVDEIDPLSLAIVSLETSLNTDGNSTVVEGYWNIDTDRLKVTLSDADNDNFSDVTDDNIIGGQVQLYADVSGPGVNGTGWVPLGTPKQITTGNRAAFFIEVDDEVAGATKGVEQIPASWNATLNNGLIAIKATVVDEAGNTTDWGYNTNFSTGTTSLTIHGIGAEHRDSIKAATADKTDGWWGPESNGLPIKIQLTASNAITVNENDGTPSIKLETGTTVAVAEYVSGSESTTLVFDYNPGVGEESSDLAFKLTSGDAIIDLNGALMYSVGGNFLKGGSNNNASSPVLPKPGDATDVLTSLDEAKDITIDGIAPANFTISVNGNVASEAVQILNNAFGDGSSSYYNSAVDEIRFNIPLGAGPDESLTIDGWTDWKYYNDAGVHTTDNDCNSLNGCGKIQIKADMVASATEVPFLRDYYAEAIDNDDLHSDDSNPTPYPYQDIDIDAGPPENCNGCDFETDFVNSIAFIPFAEGNVMIFKAVLIDLAGNQTTSASDNLIVDRVPPAIGTVSTLETEAPDAMNNVAGYWNKHNTGLRLEVPLDNTDASLVGGEIFIYGGKDSEPVTSWQKLGYYWDDVYEISAAEKTASLSIVPSTDGLLADSINLADGSYWWPVGVEEMDEYAEDVTLGFSARVYDVANNYTNYLYNNTVLLVDTTSPVIQEVTSSNEDRAYNAADTIYIAVVANEHIRAEGAASNSELELENIGGANPQIPFHRIIEDTIFYEYDIKPDESSEDDDPLITAADRLRYTDITSLTLLGGSVLTDSAGNNLGNIVASASFHPNLPALDEANSLAKLKNIIIDTDAPEVTFTYFETATAVTDSSDSLASANNIKLIIHANFSVSDSIQKDSIPKLDIDFPVGPNGDGTRGDITDLDPTTIITRGWKYEYEVPLEDSVNGKLSVTLTAYDKAANLINQTSAVDAVIDMDNVDPVFTLLGPDSNSFVNSSNVSYQLSEDVFSGKIIWKWESGTPDLNTPHEQILDATELLQNPAIAYQDITLIDDPAPIDDPEGLKDGAYYTIYWTGVDSADNPSVTDNDGNSIYASTSVLYDTTKPSVYLDYQLDNVTSEFEGGDTIWINFTERIDPNPSLMDTPTGPELLPPQINIDFLDERDEDIDIVWENITMDSITSKAPDPVDSTKWFFIAQIPQTEQGICSTIVQIRANDLSGNSLSLGNPFHVTGNDTLNYDILVVDNSAPICTLSYVNISQDWLTDNEDDDYSPVKANGKRMDIIQITAKLNEKFGTPPSFPRPLLNIDFSYLPEDFTALNSSFQNSYTVLLDNSSQNALGIDSVAQMTNGDSTAFWYVELPDTTNGVITVTINGKDMAGNPIGQYEGKDFIIDNIPPASFVTESSSTGGGNYQVPNWINGTSDTLKVLIPIPPYAGSPNDDNSLFGNPRGGVHIELWNTVTDTGFVDIPKAQEPYWDEIVEGGDFYEFYRTMDEIQSSAVNGGPSGGPYQDGHKIFVRAALSDRAGNTTHGDTSATSGYTKYLVDTIEPLVSEINDGNVTEVDTLHSSDYLSAYWTGSSDPTENNFKSGIAYYDFRIVEHDSLEDSTGLLIDWTSAGLDEFVISDTLGLLHNHQYSFNIRAVDTAGNVSSYVISDTIYRLASAPVIGLDSTIVAFEDILYTQTVQVTDLDLATVSGDQFSFTTSWNDSIIPTNGTRVDTFINNSSGLITWTPTPQDTGSFRLRVTVVDKDSLMDTVDYPLTIKPVNDPPYFRSGDAWDLKYGSIFLDLPLPDTSFGEDPPDPFSMEMTKYIYDEDNNDSTDIYWYAVAMDTMAHPSYPRTSLFFGPGTPGIVKQRLRDQYLPQHSTPQLEHQFQGELKTVGTRINAKTLGNNIVIEFQKDADSVSFAMIKPDSNYHGVHRVVFTATDNKDSSAVDTMLLTITPTNDRPQWSDIPEQTMLENDTMRFDLGAYVVDVDDTLLHFTLEVTTNGEKMAIDPKTYSSENLGDSAQFIPEKLWSDYAVIQAIAKDGSDARDTVDFTIDVIRIPRPHMTINVVQNNIFTNFYDILITDTIAKARDVYLEVQNEIVPLDTVGSHTYRGHHKFISPGTYTIEVFAAALVGDTTVYRSIGLALARTRGRWSGSSPDGLFDVIGEAGSVNMDQSILIVDSTMFKKGYSGSYKLGDEVRVFNKPVAVSIASYDEGLALYQRNTNNTWTELPSYNEQGRIRAYTDRMGYFRLGRKTLIVPGLTSLGQNYPNPFNPVTNIAYDVGFVDGPEQQVNLSIYNLLGQHVQTLVNDQQGIGRHSVMWYGRDKTGMSVASGIYFVHMVTSTGKVQTKKVMLLR